MDQPDRPDPRVAINAAIQNLVASRLGRGFVPLGLLFAWGVVSFLSGGGLGVALGALASTAAMLAYGLRIVQRAYGRPDRPWMALASAASVIPPVFAVYVLGWLGLRGMTAGLAWSTTGPAILGTLLGVWALRGWMKVVEIERLARIMTMNLDGEGGAV